jgi:excisionase family DNA binding protein
MEIARPVEQLERLVTVRAAARVLGIGRHLLYRAAEAGELPIYDPGGWSRVRLSDVLAWLERTRRVPRSPR